MVPLAHLRSCSGVASLLVQGFTLKDVVLHLEIPVVTVPL